MLISRDSHLLWLTIAGAVVGYLALGEPPTEWTWKDWMQALAFAISTATGVLTTSPLPSGQAVAVGEAKAEVVEAKRQLEKVQDEKEPKVRIRKPKGSNAVHP